MKRRSRGKDLEESELVFGVTTIPIIFSAGSDPVAAGLVESFKQPGSNVTGINFMSVDLGAKRLGLLHELRPEATCISLLINPNNPITVDAVTKDVSAAAAAIGRQIEVITAGSHRDIDTAFAALVQKRADALLVMPDPLFMTRRVQLATLAARHMVPAIYPWRDFVEAGGLMSYGPSQADRFRQVGLYTGRILRARRPEFCDQYARDRGSAETVPSSSRRALPGRKLQFTNPFIFLSNH